MSTGQGYDARDQRRGGWAWYQDELLTVFAPLIGPEASWLYIAMCKLIYDKMRNSLIELSIRYIMRGTGQSKGTVERKLKVLTGIGMLIEEPGRNNRPSTFALADLKELAALGKTELVRRLKGVPGWDTSPEGRAWEASQKKAQQGTPGSAGRADSSQTASEDSDQEEEASASSYDETVPPGDSDSIQSEKEHAELELSQNQGVTVPESGGNCPTEAGSVSHQGTLLIKTTDLNKTLTPDAADAPSWGDLILPEENLRSGSRHFPMAVGIAARWVMQGCGISEPRLQAVIIRALEQRCVLTGETLQQVAGLAAMNTREYQVLAAGQKLAMQYGWEAFFGGGHWQAPQSWQLREIPIERPRLIDPGQSSQETPQQIAVREAKDRENVVAFVLNRAQKYEEAGLAEAAMKIRNLVAESDWSFEDVDESMQAIEDEVVAALQEEKSELQLEELAAQVRKTAGESLRKMPPQQAQSAVQAGIRRRLLAERGLPRLSLFYAA